MPTCKLFVSAKKHRTNWYIVGSSRGQLKASYYHVHPREKCIFFSAKRTPTAYAHYCCTLALRAKHYPVYNYYIQRTLFGRSRSITSLVNVGRAAKTSTLSFFAALFLSRLRLRSAVSCFLRNIALQAG